MKILPNLSQYKKIEWKWKFGRKENDNGKEKYKKGQKMWKKGKKKVYKNEENKQKFPKILRN